MLLSDRWRIVKATNPDFKNEEEKCDSSSCKSDNDMQLERVMKSGNFDNFDDFDDESSSSKNENESENVDENEILPLSSPNSLTSETAPAPTTNSTEKGRWKWTQKSAITASIVEDKQISKLSIQEEEYAASKNFFESKRRTWRNSAVKNEAATLTIESSEAAELIYEIALAAKKESNSSQIPISKILQKVINHSIYESKWKKTVEKKLTSLASFNIWKLVKKISEMSIILCKWVFLIKYETDDNFKKFKARLVVREFTQQFEVDYEDIFMSVIWFDFLRVLLALAAKFEWIIHMMNAQNIYLNFKLNKEIYMKVLKKVNHLSD